MSIIEFSEFTLDLDLHRLSRAGKQVPLGRKPMDVLICLIENRHRVVSREYLRQAVWDGAKLSPAAIPTSILEVRKALGESGESSRLIQSHRGRGYRFAGTIRRIGRNLTPPSREIGDLPFVGRRRELELLHARARGSRANRKGRIVIIRGEAGIGKTRLISQFSSQLRGQFSAFHTSAAPFDGTPSFWPWTQLAIKARKSNDSAPLSFNAHVEQLAEIFPELGIADVATSFSRANTSRHEIFTKWKDAILSLAVSKPTLLTIDNVHALDRDSIRLLYWIVDELEHAPLLIIATTRPYALDAENRSLIAEIASMPDSETLELPPLIDRDIVELLDPMLADRNLIAGELARRTYGNAFYLSHILRCEENPWSSDALNFGPRHPPMHPHDIVARQLSGLPPSTKSALRAASVLGEQFHASLLASITSAEPGTIAEVLDPAIAAWVLRSQGDMYEFQHSILRESLYETLDPHERKSLHLRASREIRATLRGTTDPAEVAYHLTAALPLSREKDALNYAHRAAVFAAERFAYAQAKTFFERALDLLDRQETADTLEKCDLLIGLSQTVLHTGDRKRSRKLLIDASQLARAEESAERLAHCAIALAPDYLSIEVGAIDPVLIQLLQEALALAGSECLALRAKLLARLSQAQQWSSRPQLQIDLADQSLSAARQSDSDEALIAALTAQAESQHGPARASARLDVLRELGDIARESGNHAVGLLQHTRLIAAYLELGQVNAIEIENRQHESLSEIVGLRQFRWYGDATRSMLSTLRGEIDEGDELARSYAEIAGPEPDQNFRQTFACQAALRMIERDRTLDVLPSMIEFARSQSNVRSWRAAVAWAQLEVGHPKEAQEILKTFNSLEIESLAQEAGGGIGLASLAEVVAVIGSDFQKELALRLVEAVSDRFASAGYGVAYFGSFHRYHALLLRSVGNQNAAVAALEEAIVAEEGIGARSWAACARSDLARTQVAAGTDPSDTILQLHDFLDHDASRVLSRARRIARQTIGEILPQINQEPHNSRAAEGQIQDRRKPSCYE